MKKRDVKHCDNCLNPIMALKYHLRDASELCDNEWKRVAIPCVLCGHINVRMAKDKDDD